MWTADGSERARGALWWLRLWTAETELFSYRGLDCRSMRETAEISLTRSFQIHGPAGRKVVPTKVDNLTVGTNGALGNRVLADRVYTAIRTSSPRCRGVTCIRSRTRNQWRQTIEGVDNNREILADKSSGQTHSKPTGVRWRSDRRSLKGTLHAALTTRRSNDERLMIQFTDDIDIDAFLQF